MFNVAEGCISTKRPSHITLRQVCAGELARCANTGRFTHSMLFPCRAPVVPLPCPAAKGLECVSFFSRPRHSMAVYRRPCMVRACHGCGMASVKQKRPHCVNQMGKTHSKPLEARHGRGKIRARHGHGMLCVNRP